MKGWLGVIAGVAGLAAGGGWAAGQGAPAASHVAPGQTEMPRSAEYAAVQDRLARGWNTWDVHSVATQVLLPEGLAIHVGMKHNTSENSDAWLGDALIGRLDKGAEVVMPGPHAWDGSYTSADYAWKGHKWRVESAHDGADLVMLVTPLGNAEGALPPTVVFSVDFLWNRAGAELKHGNTIEVRGGDWNTEVYCACAESDDASHVRVDAPVSGPYFAVDLTKAIGVSTGKQRTIEEIHTAIANAKAAYE